MKIVDVRVPQRTQNGTMMNLSECRQTEKFKDVVRVNIRRANNMAKAILNMMTSTVLTEIERV